MSTAVLAPTTVTINIPGVLTTSLVGKVALPFAGTITSAMAVVSTAATGSSLNFTLVKGAVNAGVFSIASGAETDEATGLQENTKACKKGGKIAKDVRLQLEKQTKKNVVTGENFLPLKKTINKSKK